MKRSELRKDPLTGRWVVIAPARGFRPVRRGQRLNDLSGNEACQLCESVRDEAKEIYKAQAGPSGVPVRVIPNKYPALTPEAGFGRSSNGFYDSIDGVGAHELVVEGDDPLGSFEGFGPEGMRMVLEAYRARIRALRKDSRFKYALAFKNKGISAGASQRHPHSQLIATPVVPFEIKEEIRGGRAYFERNTRCFFCDMISFENGDRSRLISETDDFIALAPFASRHPYESWIFPKRHGHDFGEAGDGELDGFAQILDEVLGSTMRCLGDPDYNFFIHTAPLQNAEEVARHFHWHLELLPRTQESAGFELGTGFHINSVPPESAAEELRRACLTAKK